jgi:secreted PhoX family phosphatase
MMLRRRFLQSLVIAAATPALPLRAQATTGLLGPLRPDPAGVLDLPEGFSHRVVSRAGERMDDGLLVPQAHDGMAAFPAANGRITLVCNHELAPHKQDQGAFAGLDEISFEKLRPQLYDAGGGATPGVGGTTTTIYDPATGRTERQHLSLAGTDTNCAGGPTPWGSWLSCEECFESPGTTLQGLRIVMRERRHGYVFEVPAAADGLVEPRPIRAMGRFEHEAAAVDSKTGIVYLTEDRHHSLFYRYIPDVPGALHEGGRLQALAVDGRPALATHNWSGKPGVRVGEPLQVHWIDLEDVDPDENDLRERGAAAGAATFARGEGLSAAGDNFVFTCTIGGPARLGQVFAYWPSPREGQADEKHAPGHLVLVAESTSDSLLANADNITMAPWGDLVACEDTAGHCGLIGIRPDGTQYAIADNAYSNSELAGACFSPDGRILFVNIQYPGLTLAITGAWPT